MSHQTRKKHGEKKSSVPITNMKRAGLNRLIRCVHSLQCPGTSKTTEPVKAKTDGFWGLKGVDRQSTEDS